MWIGDRVKAVAGIFWLAVTPLATAQSTSVLEAKLKSMEACRLSLSHKDCNLKILDKDLRESLIKLDQLNKRVQNSDSGAARKFAGDERVRFFTSSIWDANREAVKLTDGSVWKLDSAQIGMPIGNVVGVLIDSRKAVIYVDGNAYGATLVSGVVITSDAIVQTVVQKLDDGTVLKLANGVLLEFSSYDRYDTGWWLPPYKVLIELNAMNMWHLDKGKKVWIQRFL